MFDEKTGNKVCTVKVEIQTRSIFEEGWSEINHKLLYKKKLPKEIEKEMLNISDILATMAGTCDRLGELLKDYRIEDGVEKKTLRAENTDEKAIHYGVLSGYLGTKVEI